MNGTNARTSRMAEDARWVLSEEGAKAFEQAKRWREKRRHHKERRRNNVKSNMGGREGRSNPNSRA